MDYSNHSRPQSPDLSNLGGYPVSPDLSGGAFAGLQPPELSSLGSPRFGNNINSHHRFQQSPAAFGGHSHFGTYQPTSDPQAAPIHDHSYYQPDVMAPRRGMRVNYQEQEDEDEFMQDAAAPAKRQRVKQEPTTIMESNGISEALPETDMSIKPEDSDPTLGCTVTTSFPVARIKRIMQADEDIGKVAQVTPTVVSRALELFMIKLISASADQARGTSAAATKGPRRVLAQHLKKAVVSNEKFDFLNEIVDKVPDAPTKSKKEAGSDSEDPKPKKRGKKRKDSGDDV